MPLSDNSNQDKVCKQQELFPLITLIGAAERGDFCRGNLCKSLWQLWNIFGQPPGQTEALFYAIQALSLGSPTLFFRVEEEGFSTEEYEICLENLDEATPKTTPIGALFLPGVGTSDIIEHSLDICSRHAGVLIMNDKDFYDYVTQRTH